MASPQPYKRNKDLILAQSTNDPIPYVSVKESYTSRDSNKKQFNFKEMKKKITVVMKNDYLFNKKQN